MNHVVPERPLPLVDPDSREFWQWCQHRQLRIQRCVNCLLYIHAPAPVCSRCGSTELGFTRVKGTGSVYTFTVIHRAISASFQSLVPYVVAWIELDEQPQLRVISNIVGMQPDSVKIGMRVRLDFEETSEGFVLPVFRKAETG